MSLREALLSWIAHLALLGAPAESALNPPADAAQIAAAEREIGFEFPPELRELYLLADGQRLTETGEVALLFGDYGFVPLKEALQEYRTWQSVYEDDQDEFGEIYNWTTRGKGTGAPGLLAPRLVPDRA
jgi:cell wall assembly regulator SMI1